MRILKPNHARGDDNITFNGNRLIEIDDRRLAAMGIGDFNDLDMKYELFCKWLQQNEQNHLTNAMDEKSDNEDGLHNSSATILTEDEVSSFATNSDDSESDIFLDTESDFPSIVLSSDGCEEVPFYPNIGQQPNGTEFVLGECRVDTPSQLSVSDFDCSSSDITVNSRISATSDSSSQATKRKAKHKKGRAPPIPGLAKTNTLENDQNHTIDTAENIELSEKRMPSIPGSARETDI